MGNQEDRIIPLRFVQTLQDPRFGTIDILRNDESKFFMKMTRTFLVGDKRETDFKAIFDYVSGSTNPCYVPITDYSFETQRNICIDYEIVSLYCEYYNFTLRDSIKASKALDESELLLCLKLFCELALQIEEHKLYFSFDLASIFATLNGTPCVYLFDLISKEDQISIQLPTMAVKIGQAVLELLQCLRSMQEDSSLNNPNDQKKVHPPIGNKSLSHSQLTKSPLRSVDQGHQSQRPVSRKAPLSKSLIKFIEETATQLSEELLSVTDCLQLLASHQGSIAKEIRFNKFKYILKDVAESDKSLNRSGSQSIKANYSSTTSNQKLNNKENQPKAVQNLTDFTNTSMSSQHPLQRSDKKQLLQSLKVLTKPSVPYLLSGQGIMTAIQNKKIQKHQNSNGAAKGAHSEFERRKLLNQRLRDQLNYRKQQIVQQITQAGTKTNQSDRPPSRSPDKKPLKAETKLPTPLNQIIYQPQAMKEQSLTIKEQQVQKPNILTPSTPLAVGSQHHASLDKQNNFSGANKTFNMSRCSLQPKKGAYNGRSMTRWR